MKNRVFLSIINDKKYVFLSNVIDKFVFLPSENTNNHVEQRFDKGYYR